MGKWNVRLGFNDKIVAILDLDDNLAAPALAKILIEKQLVQESELLGEVHILPGEETGEVCLVDDSGYPYATLKRVNDGELTLSQVAAQASDVVNSGPKCPTCGSTHIEKIGVMGRAIDGWFFGRHSVEGRAQFLCKTCGYRW